MPTTTGFATEFITFSRGSLATVTDSNGYIKWAPHNLLLASEQFDGSSWTKSSATVTANSIAAPDGTTTADTIAASGANGTTLQSYSAIAVSYVFGVWLKRKTGTGTIEIAADSGTYTAVTITSDWALYTVTQTPAAGSKSAGIRIVTSADEVYAWGAHLYRSDLGGMQANASAYPYYNPSTPKNLLGYSEAFDNAAWAKDMTVTANAATAPNGSLSADLLSGSNGQYITQTYGSAVLSSPHIASVYVKANTISSMRLAVYKTSDGANGYVDFNLASQTAGTPTGNFPPTNATITSVGDGWYRCSFKTAFNTGTGIGYALYNFSGATGSFYAWGAQLSDSASLDPYVGSYGAAPSAAAAYGPRLDYDPSTLAAKGLLVEEQRTNLLQYSDIFTNVVWSTGSLTVTGNTVQAPSGSITADTIARTTTGSSENNIRYTTSQATTTEYTVSVYVKANTIGAKLYLRNLAVDNGTTNGVVHFDPSNGSVSLTYGSKYNGKASMVPVGNGWYRCSITGTTYSTISTNFVDIGVTDGSLAVGGTSGSGIYIWGAQLEAAAFATSYIPTAAATVTRNADVAFVATSQFPLGSTEGTIVTSATPIGFNVANFITTLQDASLNNFVQHYYQSATNLRVNVVASGGTVAEFDNAVVMGATHKVATAFKANDFASSFNGGSSQTDNTGTAPTGFTTLNIGRRSDGFTLNGHIRQITYIPRRLTNAELQARTA